MFSKRSRRAIGVAAAVVTAVGLTACGNGGSQTAADGKVHVTFWQQKFEDYQQAWFKKNVQAFNASQDEVTVDLQVVPADTWEQKLQAAQAAGKQPDIATTSYGNIKSGVAEGKFAPLDELLPAEAFSDLKENVAPFVTVEDEHYAYPMLVEPSTVLYYRSDLVKDAGLDPESPPESWDELLEWSKALTKGDVKGMTVASTAADLSWSSWGLQLNACGYLPIADDWSAARATEPCFADLAGFYKELYQGGLIPQQPKVGYADGQPYGEGEVAMMQGGSWVVGQLKNDFPDVVDKTMVAPFPSVDGDVTKTTATLGGWTLTLDTKSEAPKEAAQFIEYLLAGDPEIMADFFKETGYSKYTVRDSVDELLADDPEASADPFMAVISDQVVPYGQAEPAYPYDIALAMGTALESAMKGTKDVDGSLQTADDAINDIIEKQKLAGTATD
jgi:multiple sugar transport system substrate-binding protein